MGIRAETPILSKKQATLLNQIEASRTERRDHSMRASIILMASQGKTNKEISKSLMIQRGTSGKWRHRWVKDNEALAYADDMESGSRYKRLILKVLSDKPRAGAPCKFTPEQLCQIINVACETPEDAGLPLSHWSLPSLASEIQKRGIVESISSSKLSVFLNEAEIKPHRVKEWIHTPIENEVEFNQTVNDLCALYAAAPSMHEQNIHVVSADEKTGMQAIDRQITPMKAGQCERQDSSYERHGTQCLIANFDVATGKVIAPSIGDTRTEYDFSEHIRRLVAEAPNDEWVIIVDQLNTHKSASLVALVACHCGLNQDLGVKGKEGVLKNMETRAAFLTEKSHAIRFAYTPKHASWLNQVEVWFSILSRRLLKRLTVKSQEELKQKVLSFIEYFNKALAKPFKWICKGRPIAA